MYNMLLTSGGARPEWCIELLDGSGQVLAGFGQFIDTSNLGGLGLILGLIALYLLGTPLLLLTQKHDNNLEIMEFDPEASQRMPRRIKKFLLQSRQDLTACGFRPLSAVALPAPVSNTSCLLEVSINERTGEAVMVTAIFAFADPVATIEVTYIEFISRFRDEDLSILMTNNQSHRGAYPEPPDAKTFRLPAVSDARQLYKYHRALVDRHALGRKPWLRVMDEFHGNVAEYLKVAAFREEYERNVGTGYLKYNEAQDCYQFTLKGIYLVGWSQLWPFKQISEARIRRAAARLQSELAAFVN